MKSLLKNGVNLKEDGPAGSYVNYANGQESLEELYGHDRWRLERLRRLKEQYDPTRRFSYYAPI